ncbi:MAG: hypothetical protein ACRD22_02135 [Terriglobia bacterium]
MTTKVSTLTICMGLAAVAHALGSISAQAAAPSSQNAGVTGSDPQEFNGFWMEDTRALRRGPPGAPPGGRPRGGAPAPGAGPPGGGPGALLHAAIRDHLQPWAAKREQAYQDALAAGHLLPTNAIRCLPWAIAGIGIPGGPAYGMDIIATSRRVVFLYQLDHQARIVYLNQPHPKGLTPSYFGNSVGHWEGNVLVVDSIGFNDKTEIADGVPHTLALHVVERLQIDGRHDLEDHVTFEDPGAFKQPISYVDLFARSQPYQEYVCAEDNHEANIQPKQ